jgi:phospholipase C
MTTLAFRQSPQTNDTNNVVIGYQENRTSDYVFGCPYIQETSRTHKPLQRGG